MYSRLGCPPQRRLSAYAASSRSSNLGAVQLAPLAISTASGIIGSIFGQDDATKKRFAAIDARKAQALAGDYKALVGLKCWAGDQSAVSEWNALTGENVPPNGCGMPERGGARAYAAKAVGEVMLRQAAGATGTALIQQSDIPYRATAAVATASPWVIGAVAVGAALVLSKRRR